MEKEFARSICRGRACSITLASHMSLFKKALVLLTVPAIFQIVFVIALCSLLQNADYQRVRAEKSKAIIRESSALTGLIVDAGTALSLAVSTRFRGGSGDFERRLDSISRQVIVVERLVRGNKKEERFVDEIQIGANEAIRLFLKLRNKMIDAGHLDISYFSEHRTELSSILAKIKPAIAGIVAAERADTTNVQVAAARRLLNQGIVFGVSGNILIALVLAVLFHRDTMKRLNALMNNLEHFSRKQPLETAIEGSDELAQLDERMRVMVSTVREAEEQKSIADEKLAQLKKEFFAMLAHDLRAPLSSIRLSVESFANAPELAPTTQETLRSSRLQLDALMGLINELLEVERLELGRNSLKLEEFPAYALIEEVEAISGPAAKLLGVDLCFTPPPEVIVVADQKAIVRLMVNLITNAVKYSASGDTVTISVTAESTRLHVSVCDTGPGVSEAQIATIFDKF
ncbi:MAG: HAMP domain-containing histidine kinase, partial [Cyanobacteria bacterium]|nr:HAMP domain-containing histidine kinase [Cyanobacteriota bacterium]